jgi:hypothetical protein
MTIQTLLQPALRTTNGLLAVEHATVPRVIVAAEGSELADRLRASGWVARAGWRRHAAGRSPIWLVRFEYPLTSSEVFAA